MSQNAYKFNMLFKRKGLQGRKQTHRLITHFQKNKIENIVTYQDIYIYIYIALKV